MHFGFGGGDLRPASGGGAPRARGGGPRRRRARVSRRTRRAYRSDRACRSSGTSRGRSPARRSRARRARSRRRSRSPRSSPAKATWFTHSGRPMPVEIAAGSALRERVVVELPERHQLAAPRSRRRSASPSRRRASRRPPSSRARSPSRRCRRGATAWASRVTSARWWNAMGDPPGRASVCPRRVGRQSVVAPDR